MRTIFLQMDKCAGPLNQPFVKRSVGPVFVLEPKMFQHFVRFVKKLPVEAIEIPGIMRVEFLSAERLHLGGDAGALVTHITRVKSKARSPKSKVAHSRQGASLPPSWFPGFLIQYTNTSTAASCADLRSMQAE